MLLAKQGDTLTEQYAFQRPDGTAPTVTGTPQYRVENGAGTVTKALANMTAIDAPQYAWTWAIGSTQTVDTYYVYASGTFDGLAVTDYLIETVQLVLGDYAAVVGGGAGLCTRGQVKAAISIGDADDDDLIDSLIDEVTQTFMREYGREFVGQSTATRTFRVTSRYVDLAPFDLRAATTVTLHPEEASPTTLTLNEDYVLSPVGGAEKTGTYLSVRLADDLEVSSDLLAKFGYAQLSIAGDWGVWAGAATVAEDVRRSAIETVAAMIDRPSAAVASYEVLGDSRPTVTRSPGWSIPMSAHRRMRLYSRNLGVY